MHLAKNSEQHIAFFSCSFAVKLADAQGRKDSPQSPFSKPAERSIVDHSFVFPVTVRAGVYACLLLCIMHVESQAGFSMTVFGHNTSCRVGFGHRS